MTARMAASLSASQNPVLHVVVVGFHHKKGCQVDYSYPPLISGGEVHSTETPKEWKNLPSLAIPDGAHNYVKDTIYFHLPAREGYHRTVHGVACYRQIDSKDLRNRTDDITRSTVQKSVCVLSYLPLYGLIQAKLELITHAYFDELDFTKVSLLEETYRNLNASLTNSLLNGGSQVFLGMTVRDIVLQFKHKIVLLFKLIMLERRVLFTGTPVEKLCNFILSILSLFPGMIEHGLIESANYGIHKHISQKMKMTSMGSLGSDSEDFMEIRYSDGSSPELHLHCNIAKCNSQEPESPTMERGDRTNTPEKLQNCDKKENVQSVSENNNITQQNLLFKESYDSNYYADESDRRRKDSVNENVRMSGGLEYVEDYFNGETCHVKMEMHSDKVKFDHSMATGSEKDKNFSDIQASDAQSHSDEKLSEKSHGQPRSHHWSGDLSHDKSRLHDKPRMRHYSDNVLHESRRVLLSESSSLMMGVTQLETVQAGVETDIPKNDSVINIEDLLQPSETAEDIDFIGSEREKLGSNSSVKSLNLDEPSPNSAFKDDTVEELDSPESISQIDREDCFSWEEDRLLLAIDENAKPVDDTAGLVSSFKEQSPLDRQLQRMNSKTQSEKPNEEKVEKAGTEEKSPGTEQTITKEGSRESSPASTGSQSSPGMKAAAIKNRLSNAFSGFKKLKGKTGSPQESPSGSEPVSPAQEAKELPMLPVLHQDEFGFPLAIFTKGSICHPYLSLQYFDLLNDVNVRSFVIGATNILFRQKRHLTDVVIDISESKIDLHDRELQRQLALTTADLRFADILVKAVTEQSDDIYLDGTEWEGGDEWLRAQFRLYLESMCATVLSEDPKLIEDFGQSFIQTWKTTHNYRVWASQSHPGFDGIQKGHPYQGNLGMADIRVRLAHTMQSTERGKKINAAVSQTGKYVVQTGRAVGGALTQAKSSLSSWFSSLTTSEKPTHAHNSDEHPAVHKPTPHVEK